MNLFLFIATATVFLSCAPQKTTETPVVHADTTVLARDTAILPTPPEKMGNDSIPACISKLIADFSSAPVQNPPRKIWSYTYNNRTVYYVPPVCCDNFSDLYDADCQLLGHPDGGFSGRGDGNFADFAKERTNEKLVWQDKRK
jgi:hypothetical protein